MKYHHNDQDIVSNNLLHEQNSFIQKSFTP